MRDKIELGTLESIADDSLRGLSSVEVAVSDGKPYLLIPQSRRSKSILRVLDVNDLLEITNCELPQISDKELTLGAIRYHGASDDLVICRHFWVAHGLAGLSQWDYGFLGTKLSSLVKKESSKWLNLSVGNNRIADFDVVQKDGTQLYFVSQNDLWGCPLKEGVKPVQHGTVADQLTSNGRVLYVQWYEISDFKNPWKVYAYDFNKNQRLEDKTQIVTPRSMRCQYGFLFVETATHKKLPKKRKSKLPVASKEIEIREIDIFRESDPVLRQLTYVGTFRVPGEFNPPSPNAQLFGTMFTEMAYCPTIRTLFAVANGKLFKGKLRDEEP